MKLSEIPIKRLKPKIKKKKCLCLFIGCAASWSLRTGGLYPQGWAALCSSGAGFSPRRLLSPGAPAREHSSGLAASGPSCPGARWDIPGAGIEPLSPALAGRFPTTGPPETFNSTVYINRKPPKRLISKGVKVAQSCPTL